MVKNSFFFSQKASSREVSCSFTSYWEENELPRRCDDIFPQGAYGPGLWQAVKHPSVPVIHPQMLSIVIFQTPCPDLFQIPGVSQDLQRETVTSASAKTDTRQEES